MDGWRPDALAMAKGPPSSSAVTSGYPLPPIRAPLSGDTDDDDGSYDHSSEVSAKSDRAVSRSSDDFASFLSGDDEFESASERAWDAADRFDDERVEEEQHSDGGLISIVRRDAMSSFPGIYGRTFTMAPIAKVSSDAEDDDGEVGDGVSSDGDDGFRGVVRVYVEPVRQRLVGGGYDELGVGEEGNSGAEGLGLGKTSGAEGGIIGVVGGDEGQSDFRIDTLAETIGSSAIGVVKVEDGEVKLDLETEVAGAGQEFVRVGGAEVDSSMNGEGWKSIGITGVDRDGVANVDEKVISELLGSGFDKKTEASNEPPVESLDSRVAIDVEALESGVVCVPMREGPLIKLDSKGSAVADGEDYSDATSCINVDLGTETVVLVEALKEEVSVGAESNNVEDKGFADCKTHFADAEQCHASACLLVETGVEEDETVGVAPSNQGLESELEPVAGATDMGSNSKEFQTSSYVEESRDESVADSSDCRGRLQDSQETPPTSSWEGNDADGPLILSAASGNEQELHDIDDGATAAGEKPKDLSFVKELEELMTQDTVEDDDGEDDKLLFDSATLTALLKAATNVNATNSSSHPTSGKGPAGLGSSVPSLRASARHGAHASVFATATRESETDNMDNEEKKFHEKVNMIRMKFLRLVHRLGLSLDDTVAAQVLFRLALAEGTRRSRTGRVFSLDAACQTARKLEEGKDDIDFSCTILVIGKTGVGKSATINSIFGEEKTPTNAFQPATSMVREITGIVDGVKIRAIDTPGLRPSVMEQSTNRKILSSVMNFTKKFPPDIVLYVDRMDTHSPDSNDLPLLQSITSILGASIWFNAIVALTHASSAPPHGPSGAPLSYETSVAHRSHAVQHSIRQAAGDMRLMNPVALVENHPSCRRNREGQLVLPNGQCWLPQLLLLCYSTKILSEANSLLKLQDPASGKLLFGGLRYRSAPLPSLLASLLLSRSHANLASADQGDVKFDMEVGLSDIDSDEEHDEYDQLPPFRPLTKSQIAKLSKEQRKAYFEEYDYRVKLFQKKQLEEELRQRREATKHSGSCTSNRVDNSDPEDGRRAAARVQLPDKVLPSTFDGDTPAYRYRLLEPVGSQMFAHPVLDLHGWDHDCGYDGVSLEGDFAVAGRFPVGLSLQIGKDKKEFTIDMDSSISIKHGDHGSTLAGFDIHTVGKQRTYIFRGESKFKNFKRNKTAAGLSLTLIGDTLVSGVKIEDQISIGRRASLAAGAGAVHAQGEVAYGANLEAQMMEKDYPIGQDATTLGLSLMQWRRELALGAILQTQFSVGRGTKSAVRIGLNSDFNGQITIRTSSSEQLQIALVGLLPVVMAIYRSIWSGES